MTMAVERLDELVTALRTVLRDEQILTSKPDRYNRARVPAPFPVHRWSQRLPDLADGAVPLRGGIVVDVKAMNAIKVLDLANRTVTVGTGINMLTLNEQLARHGLFYPDDPASYPCSLVGGRIGTSGWSLIGSRHGHTRDLVLSFDHVLPTGEVMHVGDGVGHKVSKSSSGYQLKHLFMGHQGTRGIATEATLKLFPKPEAELSPFWAFDNYDDAYACVGARGRPRIAIFTCQDVGALKGSIRRPGRGRQPCRWEHSMTGPGPRAAAAVVLALVASSCASNTSGEAADSTPPPSASTTTPQKPQPPPSQPSSAPEPGTTITTAASDFGPMLFDAKKQAIYIWESEQTVRPECYDDCAEAWPPVLTDGAPTASGEVDAALLGTTKRRDGTTQVTYKGHPLYFYAHEGPGEVKCHNISTHGGLWWVVNPDGIRAP